MNSEIRRTLLSSGEIKVKDHVKIINHADNFSCRHYLVRERDRDRRRLPRSQGLPQRCCHPLLLVHQHSQLWPDTNCKYYSPVAYFDHVAFFRVTLSTISLFLVIMMWK